MLLFWDWLEKRFLRIRDFVVMKLSLNVNYENMNVTCFRVENSFVKLTLSSCLEADIFHKREKKNS